MTIKTTKQLQTHLNAIGISCGSADGIIGPRTRAAIKAFQRARGLDADGIAGPLTFAELNRKENVSWSKSKYFERAEFRCQCGGYCKGADGYPAPLDAGLIDLLNKLRAWLGKPIYVTSGLRCCKHNLAVGGVADSKHQSGNAADISWDGIDDAQKRRMIDKAYALGADYAYTNDSNMCDAVHVDVKR